MRHIGLAVAKLPQGAEWTYEIKLDGYRLEAVRSAGRTTLYSRRQNVLNQRFHYIATALKDLPDDTVIDGELVALGPDGESQWAPWILIHPTPLERRSEDITGHPSELGSRPVVHIDAFDAGKEPPAHTAIDRIALRKESPNHG